MKPDRDDYSLDEVALYKAGIDPMTCRDSVRCAVKRELPGCHQAEANLMQLHEAIEAGVLIPSRVVKPPQGVLGSDDIYISKEDCIKWQAKDNNPLKEKSKSNDIELSGKSRSSILHLVCALCLLIARYESGQGKPKHFENRKIISDDGTIKAKALRELLQEIDRNTPSRAEELIKEAFRLKD